MWVSSTDKYEFRGKALPEEGNSGRQEGQVRTGDRGARAGGGEVKAGHLFVAVLLDAYELPLIHHIWFQAFNGV